jgi:hypothetical protein
MGVPRRGIALGLAAGALLVLPAAAAAVPANDDYAAAQTLTTNTDTAGDNTGATLEGGESTANGSASVWYSWTAPATEMVQIPISEELAVTMYTASGAVPPLTNLVSVPWTFNGYSVVGATTYKIEVAGSPPGQAFILRVSDQLPVITFDSGPGTTTSSTPTWDFHAATPVNHFSCEVDTPDHQEVAFDICDPPWTSPSLLPGDYLLRLLASSQSTPEHPGESWFTERPFTVQPAPPDTPGQQDSAGPTGQRAAALKKCKKKKKGKARAACKRRAKRLPA